MISSKNGQVLPSELDQIRQSIQDILTTPIGTRIMRREYGSLLHKLTDAPFNEITLLQLYAATAHALLQWENRIQLVSINMTTVNADSFVIDLKVQRVNQNEIESLNIPLNLYGASL